MVAQFGLMRARRQAETVVVRRPAMRQSADALPQPHPVLRPRKRYARRRTDCLRAMNSAGFKPSVIGLEANASVPAHSTVYSLYLYVVYR